MLSKSSRLPRHEFAVVKKHGQLIRANGFGLIDLKRPDHTISRFGFIVSRKVAKKATRRNRLKRLLREAVRSELNQLSSTHDIIFLAQKNLKEQSLQSISRSVNRAFQNLSK